MSDSDEGPNREIVVAAPSRLHFGMFSFGVAELRQFGGVGVMIDAPTTRLRFSRADCDNCVGKQSDRLQAALAQARAATWAATVPPCRIELLESPPSHVGLGSGTQTALAIVAGLRTWGDLPPLPAAELAAASGRAKRSAVGLYGFLHGGLIVEAGRLPNEVLSPLTANVRLPDEWRVVLVCPRAEQGLSGESERAAFAALPPVAQSLADELHRIALERLLPAARRGEFADFSDAVYRFGFTAGHCFKSHQAGVYATKRLANLVDRIRQAGVTGVGQSSWGPTLFTWHRNAAAAERFAAECRKWPDAGDLSLTVAVVNRTGARVGR